jgi:hypothetical protein
LKKKKKVLNGNRTPPRPCGYLNFAGKFHTAVCSSLITHGGDTHHKGHVSPGPFERILNSGSVTGEGATDTRKKASWSLRSKGGPGIVDFVAVTVEAGDVDVAFVTKERH